MLLLSRFLVEVDAVTALLDNSYLVKELSENRADKNWNANPLASSLTFCCFPNLKVSPRISADWIFFSKVLHDVLHIMFSALVNVMNFIVIFLILYKLYNFTL